MRFPGFALLLLLAGLLGAAGTGGAVEEASGSEEGSQVVKAIQIEGMVNVKPSDISARLNTRIGAALTRDTLREDLKEIWSLGKFEDVYVEVETVEDGYRVIFVVRERPIVDEIKYVGFKALGDKELEEKMPVKKGDFFDPVKAKGGEDAFLQAYREKGYPEVSIKHEVDPSEKERGKASLIFSVTEGPKVKINEVSFSGNTVFAAGALKKVLKNKEPAFFFHSGLYMKDELKNDEERLLSFYKNEGYQKARVLGSEVTPANVKKPNRVDIKFTLVEGGVYRVESVEFRGATLFQVKELEDQLDLWPGEKLSQKDLDKGLAAIRSMYTTRGYIYANIVPDIEYRDQEGLAVLKLRVFEGTIAYLDEILIRGNSETKDKVILRELVIKPGEAFNTDKIRKSQERVYNLGFFEDVKVYTEPSMKSGKENLIFEVKERQTGTVSIGGGYSSQYGFVGFLQLTKANLFGLGIRISAEWELGQKRTNIQLDYFDPYLLDLPVSLSLGFWDTDRDLPNTFSQRSTGGSIEFGYRLWEDWRVSLGYKYQIDDVDPLEGSELPEGVVDEPQRTSSPILTVRWDTRDDIFDPLKGHSHRWFGQVAGGPLPSAGLKFLGGDTHFYKVIYDASYFQPSPIRVLPYVNKPSLGLHVRLGRAWGGDGEEVPLFERFFLGGTDSVRGYSERELGPRDDDPVFPRPIGGNAMWQLNAEVKWPVVSRVLTIAAPFYDMGNVWTHFPLTMDNVRAQYDRLAQSVGIGVRLTIPSTIIVIRLDYGWALKDVYDENGRLLVVPAPNGRLHFNIGNIF